MAHKIFKYPLEIKSEQLIEMPHGSKILKIKTQKMSVPDTENQSFTKVPCIWALVSTDADKGKRKIIMYETGYDVNTSKEQVYLDSIEVDGMMYHLFEEK